MSHKILITVLCFALASLGILGLHGHVPGVGDHHGWAAHVHTTATHADHGAHLVTMLDADHLHGHQHDGDVDIDPVAKAFGKLPLVKALVAIVIAYLIVELLTLAPSRSQLWQPLRRPPKRRPRPYLLPPSHAPPYAAPVR